MAILLAIDFDSLKITSTFSYLVVVLFSFTTPVDEPTLEKNGNLILDQSTEQHRKEELKSLNW